MKPIAKNQSGVLLGAGHPAPHALGAGLPTPPDSLRWPHRVAVLLALVVFPLIWVGGLVTTWDAGMAVPDWPNTYGYNMFAYPLYDWFFGPWDLFVEHGHRLLGTVAGVISIGLVVVTYRSTSDPVIRRFAWVLLALVIVQGMIGGARVLMDRRDFAKLHGCVGPAYFAAIFAFIVVTGRWWTSAIGKNLCSRAGVMVVGTRIMLVASYLQLVLGSMVRHVSLGTSPMMFSWLVWMHVIGAFVVTMGTAAMFVISRRGQYRASGLRGPVSIAILLVFCQFGLGLVTWVVKYGWPAWLDRWGIAAGWTIGEKTQWQMNLVTLHVAVGSLILAIWTVAAFRSWRLVSPTKVEWRDSQADASIAAPGSGATGQA